MAVMVIRLSAYATVALVVTQRSVSQIELSSYQAIHRTIDHFTVVALVSWPSVEARLEVTLL